MDVIAGLQRKLSAEELMVLEKTLESPLDCKEIQAVHPKGDESWVFTGRTDAEAETPTLSWDSNTSDSTWCEELTHLEDPDAGKDWRQEEKGTDDRGWEGWMASLTQWTWVWVNFRSWWWTGRPGVLWFMGSQRVRHDWVDWTELNWFSYVSYDLYNPMSSTEKTNNKKAYRSLQRFRNQHGIFISAHV